MKLFVRVLWVLLMSSLAQALECAGGSGDPNDPYQIATAEQLMAIGEDPNLLDRCYVLVDDIDLDPNLSGAREFDRAVIAPGESAFTGVFDGNDHTIYHLMVIGDSYLGLFGQVGLRSDVVYLRGKILPALSVGEAGLPLIQKSVITRERLRESIGLGV